MCASKLVTGAGQRFLSPLVGSLFYCDLQVKCEVRWSSCASSYRNRTATRRPMPSRVRAWAPSSSRLSESLVSCVGVLQVVAGHRAGGVGASSSVDRLTDVPEVRLVRHRRKSFARVPRIVTSRKVGDAKKHVTGILPMLRVGSETDTEEVREWS
jgi:hypothetical protein